MQNTPKPPKFLYSFEGKRKFIIHTAVPIVIFEKIGDELISVFNLAIDQQLVKNVARQAAEFYEEYERWNYNNWATITTPYGDNKTAELTVTGTLAFLAYIEDLQEWKYLLLEGSPMHSGTQTFCVGELNMDGRFERTSEKIMLSQEPDGTIHLLVNPALIARYDPEVGGRLSYECEITTNE